jgi:Uncharacterized protein conserved in bacteria
MDIKFISDDLSVSAQITVQDIDTIKAAGFKTIMCNRPESEEANQPRFSEIALTAETGRAGYTVLTGYFRAVKAQ